MLITFSICQTFVQERTFALVTQVAGRAGRGDTPGTVLLQNRHIQTIMFFVCCAIRNSKMHRRFFINRNIAKENILRFPPSNRMVLLRVEGTDREKLRQNASELAGELRKNTWD